MKYGKRSSRARVQIRCAPWWLSHIVNPNTMNQTLKIIAAAILGLAFSFATAQENQIPVRDEVFKKPPPREVAHHFDLGGGLGIDYGGFLGVQFGFAPIKNLALFASGGYDMIGFGWQTGVKGLIIGKTEKHVARPFGMAMFGTNSVIIVEGADELNQDYLGFTVGAGVELRFGSKKKNGFDVALVVPIRSQEFWDDWNYIKYNPAFDVASRPSPIGISMGFHHEF